VRLTHAVKRIKNRDKSSDRKTRLVISELKTPKSRRTLVLTPQIVAKLRALRARQAEAKIAAGGLWRDHGLVFASEVGTPMDPDNFSHTFSKLAKRAGPGHWHPHELRHSGSARDAAARRLRDPWAHVHLDHEGRVRASARRRQAGGGRGHERRSVRVLRTPWLPAWLPYRMQEAPSMIGRGL